MVPLAAALPEIFLMMWPNSVYGSHLLDLGFWPDINRLQGYSEEIAGAVQWYKS